MLGPTVLGILPAPSAHVFVFVFKISPPHGPVVRTAKAEKRLQDRLKQDGMEDSGGDRPLTMAEQRAIEAEKRAAWRKARSVLITHSN